MGGRFNVDGDHVDHGAAAARDLLHDSVVHGGGHVATQAGDTGAGFIQQCTSGVGHWAQGTQLTVVNSRNSVAHTGNRSANLFNDQWRTLHLEGHDIGFCLASVVGIFLGNFSEAVAGARAKDVNGVAHMLDRTAEPGHDAVVDTDRLCIPSSDEGTYHADDSAHTAHLRACVGRDKAYG